MKVAWGKLGVQIVNKESTVNWWKEIGDFRGDRSLNLP